MCEIKLLAQNFNIYDGDNEHPFARTGSIGLEHLAQGGAEGVILGHSEISDTPEVINKKIRTITNAIHDKKIPEDFMPVVLIGESWEEFENKSDEDVAAVIYQKCAEIFKGIPEEGLKSMIIAYEPKWGSFGSGKKDVPPPAADLISLCVLRIEQFIKENYPNLKPFYVYGGRSTPERTLEILRDDNIDGLLLGSACSTIKKIRNIIEAMKEVKGGGKKKVIICNFKAFILEDSYEDYIREFEKLGDDFFILMAPNFVDLREVKKFI